MSEFKTIATELIKKFGAPAKITRGAGSALNGHAVLLNRVTNDERTQYIETKTNTVYFTSTAGAPLPGDVLNFNKVQYIVTGVERFNPNDIENIAWKMEVST